jgi:hypothetical protein
MEFVVPITAHLIVGLLLLGLFAWRRSSESMQIAGAEQALALFREHFPDASGTVTVAADGAGALVKLGNGAGVGILERRGRRWNARQLGPRDLRSVSLRGEVIDLTLADFGYPHARFRLSDARARTDWIARLQSLGAPTQGDHSRA